MFGLITIWQKGPYHSERDSNEKFDLKNAKIAHVKLSVLLKLLASAFNSVNLILCQII